VSIML